MNERTFVLAQWILNLLSQTHKVWPPDTYVFGLLPRVYPAVACHDLAGLMPGLAMAYCNMHPKPAAEQRVAWQ